MAKRAFSNTKTIDTEDEFGAVYESNAPLIYRFIFWRTQDEMLAEDLTGNVFVKAWRMRTSFKGGSPKAWLYKIASNILTDYWRKKKDVPIDDIIVSQLASDHITLDEAYDKKILAANVHLALGKLSPELRAVVELRFIKRMPSQQCAEQLGISAANMRVMQYRALRKLRGYLS